MAKLKLTTIGMPSGLLFSFFAVTVLIKLSSGILIPSLGFGGCSIHATKEAEEKIMPDYSTCENKTATMDVDREEKQDCTKKCFLKGLGVFSSEHKFVAKGLQTFYQKQTNATSGQIEKLCSIHETCNVQAEKELKALKESSSETVGKCKYFGLHEACAYAQYAVVTKDDSIKLC